MQFSCSNPANSCHCRNFVQLITREWIKAREKAFSLTRVSRGDKI